MQIGDRVRIKADIFGAVLEDVGEIGVIDGYTPTDGEPIWSVTLDNGDHTLRDESDLELIDLTSMG